MIYSILLKDFLYLCYKDFSRLCRWVSMDIINYMLNINENRSLKNSIYLILLLNNILFETGEFSKKSHQRCRFVFSSGCYYRNLWYRNCAFLFCMSFGTAPCLGHFIFLQITWLYRFYLFLMYLQLLSAGACPEAWESPIWSLFLLWHQQISLRFLSTRLTSDQWARFLSF